ncbi:MAG: response regulator [Cellvibrionaceae bacterium]
MGEKTILVVEDNPDNLKLVSWILEDEDFNIVAAETGEDGLAALEQHNIDLVLMDISLPGIDGKEASRRIRDNPDLAGLPIIALTAHAIQGEKEAILAAGVNDLLTKPLDEDQLLNSIHSLIG